MRLVSNARITKDRNIFLLRIIVYLVLIWVWFRRYQILKSIWLLLIIWLLLWFFIYINRLRTLAIWHHHLLIVFSFNFLFYHNISHFLWFFNNFILNFPFFFSLYLSVSFYCFLIHQLSIVELQILLFNLWDEPNFVKSIILIAIFHQFFDFNHNAPYCINQNERCHDKDDQPS